MLHAPDDSRRLTEAHEGFDEQGLCGYRIAIPAIGVAVVAPIGAHLIAVEARLVHDLGYSARLVVLAQANERKHLQRLLHQGALGSFALEQQLPIVVVGRGGDIAKGELGEHAAHIEVV